MKTSRAKLPPTSRQVRALRELGIAVPETRGVAQELVETGRRTPAAARRRTQRGRPGTLRRYWLTPNVWAKVCSHCGERQAVAVRVVDHRYACRVCIDELGINALESKAWRERNGRPVEPVKVRYVCPVCGGAHARAEHGEA